MAAGDHIAELVDRARGLHGVVGGKFGGSEDGIDLALGIHHRGACGCGESRLRAAQRIILLLVLGGGFKPFARRRGQAFDGVVDVLHGFGERFDHRLVGAHFDDLAELGEEARLRFLDLS